MNLLFSHIRSQSCQRCFYVSTGGNVYLPVTIGHNWSELQILQTLKGACDKFDLTFYPRFKKECDDYFFIKIPEEGSEERKLLDVCIKPKEWA
ncbi:hypothetical protein RIF29_04283 [Crotalaria pallida]|uniref:Uncharacterized protein n=1 Tax=Crotalaria pallida TaxID=3830 RepID=A0AAN9J1S6_CROPI